MTLGVAPAATRDACRFEAASKWTAPVRVAVSVRPHRSRNDAADAMPVEGPLIDRYGRVHDDLRISVTDRCNLRCVYCMPEEGLSFLRMDQLLTFDEITRVARVARSLGVTALRITGGEPLVRKGLPALIARLAALGFEDLALTTNGTELAGMAEKLASAGLRRVNVSCDSLRPERFASICRRGVLSVILHSMDAAESAGLTPLKVNAVVAAAGPQRRRDPRLRLVRNAQPVASCGSIEFYAARCPGRLGSRFASCRGEVFDRISARWPLEPLPDATGAPAERFRFADGRGEIGFISSVTEPFLWQAATASLSSLRTEPCGTASSPTTKRPCGTSCATTAPIPSSPFCCGQLVWAKHPGHGINEPGFLSPTRSMSMIGG